MSSRVIRIPVYSHPRGQRERIAAWTLINVEDLDLAKNKWFLHSAGYIWRQGKNVGGEGRNYVLLHRVIAERVQGAALAKGLEPDHRDFDRMNNTRSNLEPVTKLENMRRMVARRDRKRAAAKAA